MGTLSTIGNSTKFYEFAH